MKSVSIISSLFWLAVFAAPALASESCICNGLAANFPGFGLVCNDRLIRLTPFYDGDLSLAERVCEADRETFLGEEVTSLGSCECSDQDSGKILLAAKIGSTSQLLHSYRYGGVPGSKDVALGSCRAQLSELERVELCQRTH